MKAIAIEDDQLVWTDHPRPEPGPGEVRLAVAAAGVNRADLVQRAGRYAPPPGASQILGLEVSGTVQAVGAGVSMPIGTPVCALLTGGGYAEEVVTPAACCLPVPDGVDLVDAAALPEVWATVWLNLVDEAEVDAGDRVVLHAGASGVGTAALQLCALLGARTFVTAGSDEKIGRCLALGAEAGWVRHDGPWADPVREWAGGADVILDPVGGPYLSQAQQVLDTDGRWVLIGLMGGREARIDLGRLLMKRQRLIGSTLRARSVERKAAVLRALERTVWPEIEAGRIRPIVHARWPIHQAESAHRQLRSDETVGKVLLEVER